MTVKRTFVFLIRAMTTVLLGTMLFGTMSMAAEPQRMLTEKDWQAFRVDDDKGRTCFISSVPTKSTGK